MGASNPDDCLAIAEGQINAAQALRDDLMAVLFPHGGELPSELLQSQVKLKLQELVAGIEAQLLDVEEVPGQSWPILAESGLLREKSLVEFALSRLAEDRLALKLGGGKSSSTLAQLPAQLLGHENMLLAEMARKLLHAEQLTMSNPKSLVFRLESEVLHLLCWRVVAALQQQGEADLEELTGRAEQLLARHDSEMNPAIIARKLVFFLGSDYRSKLVEPQTAGLHLYIATMAQDLGLESDFLLRLIDDASVSPTLVLLKAQDVSLQALPTTLAALRNIQAPQDDLDVMHAFSSLNPVDARAAVSSWIDGGVGRG